MKKTHTFKNYQVEGIEDIYNVRMSVNHYEMKFELLDEDGKVQLKEVVEMENEFVKISKEDALRYIELWFEMEI